MSGRKTFLIKDIAEKENDTKNEQDDKKFECPVRVTQIIMRN